MRLRVIRLTLEQHKLELLRSTYMQIYFNKYRTCIFILQIFKLTKKNLCWIRDHNVWNQKNWSLSPESIQAVSASCPLMNHLSVPLFFESEMAVGKLSNGEGGQHPQPLIV